MQTIIEIENKILQLIPTHNFCYPPLSYHNLPAQRRIDKMIHVGNWSQAEVTEGNMIFIIKRFYKVST